MTREVVTFPDVHDEQSFRRTVKAAERSLFPPKDIDEVFRHYGASEGQLLEIVNRLAANPLIIATLLEADPIVERIFHPSRKYLEMERDPDGGPARIFCVITVKASPESALEFLRSFDRSWFLAQKLPIRKALNFTVEPVDDSSV